MRQCWTEQPADRPSFEDIQKTLRNINNGRLDDAFVAKILLYSAKCHRLSRQDARWLVTGGFIFELIACRVQLYQKQQ